MSKQTSKKPRQSPKRPASVAPRSDAQLDQVRGAGDGPAINSHSLSPNHNLRLLRA